MGTQPKVTASILNSVPIVGRAILTEEPIKGTIKALKQAIKRTVLLSAESGSAKDRSSLQQENNFIIMVAGYELRVASSRLRLSKKGFGFPTRNAQLVTEQFQF